MKALRTEIEVAAPPERVWQVLTDFEAYPGGVMVGVLAKALVSTERGFEAMNQALKQRVEAP